jgi:hypothetical protein
MRAIGDGCIADLALLPSILGSLPVQSATLRVAASSSPVVTKPDQAAYGARRSVPGTTCLTSGPES